MRESGTYPSLGRDWSMNRPGEMRDEQSWSCACVYVHRMHAMSVINTN